MNNRRCHGETIACHDCGPRLLAKMRGSPSAGPWSREELLQSAKDLLFHGEIIMVKSVGGYNLVCRGDRDDAIQRLRILKQRRDKPFALLVANVGEAKKLCHISREEEELLESPQKPIVLLKRRRESMPLISPAVTELTESLGVFLPPFGLYALLAGIKIPLVVTSCNLTGEPIITNRPMLLLFMKVMKVFLLCFTMKERFSVLPMILSPVSRREPCRFSAVPAGICRNRLP